MGIGHRIKEAREKAGLTQEELGKRVGITGSAITNYEKGTSHPKESVLYALMDTLEVDANFLFQDSVKTVKKDQSAEVLAKMNRLVNSLTPEQARFMAQVAEHLLRQNPEAYAAARAENRRLWEGE